MGGLLVVDGSGVCRAAIMGYALLTGSGGPTPADVVVRGLDARSGATMFEGAAGRIGHSGSAFAYFGSFRAERLLRSDVAAADLVLTAERAQRSAVVRLAPGAQAKVFTWREALHLAVVLADRIRIDSSAPSPGLVELAHAMHGARGTVALLEPAVRTRPFHWRKAMEADPLSISDGHAAGADHRRVVQRTFEVATALVAAMNDSLASSTGTSPLRTPPLRDSA